METKKDIEKRISLFVNLMYAMLVGVDILQYQIDRELRKNGEMFHQEKRKYFRQMLAEMKRAWYWYEKLDVDDSIWKATGTARKFDSFTADANELLRLFCLYTDRSHYEEGFQKIFRYLQDLPEGGLFSKEDINRFNFSRPWNIGKGDRVSTPLGTGTLELNTNGKNWIVNMDDGQQKVFSEEQFDLI